MIEPSNGRVVWYTPSVPQGQFDSDALMVQHDRNRPLTAHVVHVWGPRMVNLVVFDSNGTAFARTSVTLVQDGDDRSPNGRYCEWMPYQKGQAAKTEALEKAASGG